MTTWSEARTATASKAYSLTSRLKVTGLVAAVLLTVVAAAQLIELFINRVLRPNLEEWTWISEILVVAALLVLTALWARLRLARTAIADLERERLTIRAELAVAAKVQRALLPLIPERANGITWHAVMEPAGEVGGDYYDFFSLGNDRMCVVIADVSGKGVPRPSSCPTRERYFERSPAKNGPHLAVHWRLSPRCSSWMVEATSM